MSSPFDRGSRADTKATDAKAGAGQLAAVPHDPRSTGLTYEPFYGLREKPFSLTADARFFYHSRSHARAFDDLLNGIRRRESLNVLSGDIGTGKTTLCRAVLDALDRKTFTAFVADPFTSREELLKVLLMDFGVASVEDLTSGRLSDASRTELSYRLYEFLGTLAPLQAFAVVIVDEAQNLSIPLLEEIRILSDADGQLQVVLVGQLELRDKLKLPEMRQLDQRVSVHGSLGPLDCAGVAGYISHRLHRAGGSADRICFSGEAVEAIYERSGGVPRVINRLCDRALHQGYSGRAALIDRAMVEAANPEPRPAAKLSAPSTGPSSLPSTAPAHAPDPVDVWLTKINDLESAAAALESPPAAPRIRITPRSDADRTIEQWTSVERKWTRRLEAVVLSLALVFIALFVGPSTVDAASDLLTRANDRFATPPAVALPEHPKPQLAPPLRLPELEPEALDEPVSAPRESRPRYPPDRPSGR